MFSYKNYMWQNSKIRNKLELRVTLMVQKRKNKVAAAAIIIKDVLSAKLPSQMRQLYFQTKQRQLNLLLSICRCLNIRILQYFQIHFPVYSLFIVWILIIHTSWIHCTIIIMLPNQGKIVNICWIPSHINIYGINEADKAAKSAFEFE